MFFRSTSTAQASRPATSLSPEISLAVLALLADAIEARNAYSSGHTRRVSALARAAGRRLGLHRRELHALELASLLHDIGEIGIPDRILTKPGPLTPEEEEHMMRHPEISVRMLRNLSELEPLIPAVLHHHERFDGSGYPHGLFEQAIPVAARLLAAADAIDAMTTDRPYRSGLGVATAMTELGDCAGPQFDPDVVGAFEQAYHAGELDAILGTRTTDAAVPLTP